MHGWVGIGAHTVLEELLPTDGRTGIRGDGDGGMSLGGF